jgi:hypothetical protein
MVISYRVISSTYTVVEILPPTNTVDENLIQFSIPRHLQRTIHHPPQANENLIFFHSYN